MIVVDGNNLVYRYKRYPHINFTNQKGEHTGSVYGVLVSLISYIKKFNDTNVIMCWDSKYNLRKSTSTEYKANRNHEGDDFIFKQMNTLHEVLPFFGISSVKVYGYEADDLAYSIGKDYDGITFISKDADWVQFVDTKKGSRCFNAVDLISISLTYNYPIYHSLIGSRKDNVIGIKCFDRTGALSLAQDFDNMEVLLQSERGSLLKEHNRILLQNFDLLTPKQIAFEDKIRKPVLKDFFLARLCQYFNFKMIYSQIREVFLF